MSNAETQMLIDAAATAFQAMQENNASFVEAIGGLLALSQNQVGDIFTPNPFHENIDLQLENLANEYLKMMEAMNQWTHAPTLRICPISYRRWRQLVMAYHRWPMAYHRWPMTMD
jgi:hypothetical protein